MLPHKDNNPNRSAKPSKPHYKTIIISDTHLGKKAASAAFLFEFLCSVTCDRLILNGDIIEGWGLKGKKRKPFPEMHARCLDAINSHAHHGTDVIYTRGNHDEDWAQGEKSWAGKKINFHDLTMEHQCPIQFVKSYIHLDAQARKFLVLHGDVFDRFMKSAKGKILAQQADRAYEGFVNLNGLLRDAVVDTTGVHVSPASYLKGKFKKLVRVIEDFEKAVVSENITRHFDGVICGHIHHAEIKTINNTIYMNSGDWVEGATALTEDDAGNWSIVDWSRKRLEMGFLSIPTILDDNPYAEFRGVTERQIRFIRTLWPGKDYADLVQKLTKMQGELEECQHEFSLAADGGNFQTRHHQELLPKIGKLSNRISEIREIIRPYPV